MSFYRKEEPASRNHQNWGQDTSKGTPRGQNTPTIQYDGTSNTVNPSARRPAINGPSNPSHPSTKLDVGQVDNAGGSAKVIPEVGGEFEYQNKADRSPGLGNRSLRSGATLADIESGVDPAVVQRSRGYKPKLVRVDPRNRMWTFKVGKWDVKVKVVSTRRVTKATSADVHLTCSCPFWRWQGPEHWGQEEDYLYKSPRGTATFPGIRDPDHVKPVCKHAYAVFQVLKDYRVPGTTKRASPGPNLLDVALRAAERGRLTVTYVGQHEVAASVAEQYMRRKGRADL